MVSAQKSLAIVTTEEARQINRKASRKGLREWVIMAINKATESSIKVAVSPATIALVITLLLQTIAAVWWAATTAQVQLETSKKVSDLENRIETQKVYIDTAREKLIKLEAQVETMQQKQQLEQLLKEKTNVPAR